MTLVRRVARPMLAAIFVVQGLDQLRHPSALKAKVAPFAERAGAAGPARRPRAARPGQRRHDGRGGRAAGHRAGSPPRVPGPRRLARADDLRRPPVLGRDRPGRQARPSGSASSRTSACSAASCSPAVDTEGKPGLAYRAGLAGDVGPAHGPHAPAARPGTRRRPRAARPSWPRSPGARCPQLTRAGTHRPGRRPSPRTAVDADVAPARQQVPHQPLPRPRRPRERPVPAAAARCARATPCSWPRPCATLGARVEDVDGARRLTAPDWVVTPGDADRRRPRRLRAGRHGDALPAARRRPAPTGRSTFDGDAQARVRPMGPVLDALRSLGVDVDDERPRHPAVHASTARGVCRAAPSRSTPRRRRSSSPPCCCPAPRYDEGVTIHHDGQARALRAAHRDDRRDAARRRGRSSTTATPNTWRVEPIGDQRPRRPGRARPVQRRALPGRRARRPAAGSPCRAGRSTPPRPATRSATSSTPWAPTSPSTREGLTVSGDGEVSGIDVDLHDASELTPVVAALAALADSPSVIRGVAHIRGHETDRLAALARELGDRGADGAPRPTDGLRITPRPLSRWAVPHLRRPPHGHGRRGAGAARAGAGRRGPRHGGQDPARVHRAVARRRRPRRDAAAG